jgi:hypothetical protein
MAIESALKIVNAPTIRATPAKARRIVRRMSTNDFSPARSKRSSAAADRTCIPAETSESSPATRMRSSRPALSNSVCAAPRSKTAKVAVPSDLTSAKVAMPTTSNSRASPRVATCTRSPIA